MDRSLSCLSRWLPVLEAAKVPVPKTIWHKIHFDLPHPEMVAEGSAKPPAPTEIALLTNCIRDAGNHLGWPCFLRTGQGSNKHDWANSCFLAKPEDIESHVWNLVSWSYEADMFGSLPCDVWAVREFLTGFGGPTWKTPTLSRYHGMPLVPEWRFFIRSGEVICSHPYWPAGAICKGFEHEPDNIGEIISASRAKYNSGQLLQAIAWAAKALADAFPGESWSVDAMLAYGSGDEVCWFVTDCAQADMSWHWPGCKHEQEFKKAWLGELGYNYSSMKIQEGQIRGQAKAD